MTNISPKQLEANQNNAKKGGVKTEEGKAISKFNALKHGLLSKEVLLKDENPSTLDELRQILFQELEPVGSIEELLVDRIVTNTWRLRRSIITQLPSTKVEGLRRRER